MPTGAEIREMFLRYFESKGHKRVHSSSLVPANDPTLLFTNAGMNQFKDVFLGLEKREYNRATTAQKCVRAGGKHNDLENVGFTNRHHTFFEMLGNFSFGDYFKKDAIAYAWELVTSEKWFGIAKDKLYVTIFKGEQGVPRDDEAASHWLAQGVPKERIFEMGMKDNFWAMGDTGPCGPCSEIHYDMGVTASDAGHGGGNVPECHFPCDCGRYVEIWNLVFMQFDRDASGKLNPLPKPSIDTGAGLERVAAVLQGVISNFGTDLFRPLINAAFTLLNAQNPGHQIVEPGSGASGAASLKVIADHSRAATFLISDGVIPSNEGRGYVLRKIIRRAIRHGRLNGATKPFLYQMIPEVVTLMLVGYPELAENELLVIEVIKAEERRFAHTLSTGLEKLEEKFDSIFAAAESENLIDLSAAKHKTVIARSFLVDRFRRAGRPVTLNGSDAYSLFETYGLPRDFIEESCKDAGVEFDAAGWEKASEQNRSLARASWKGGAGKATASPVFRELKKTEFEGYKQSESDHCEILALVHKGEGVKELRAGEHGEVVLDHTPFYADSGGQVGDTGWFYSDDHNVILADVHGCVMPVQGVRAHKVTARESIHVGQKVDAVVNADVRLETMRNHTATHLLHAALRETLGKHVKQAGSLVDPKHLRFDFSHFTGVADEELQDIEDLANREVLRNQRVEVFEDVPIDVAVNEYKAMALFGEKYGDRVRVIKIGDFATELCGGTHTGATGEIGLIKILSEGSVSSGVRRLEAVTGEGSLQHFRKDHELERAVATLTSRREASISPAEAIRLELENKDDEIKKLKRELDQARMKSAASTVSSAEDKVRTVNGIKVLAQRVDNLERGQMRTLVDNMRNKLGAGVVVLGSVSEVEGEKKVALVVGVTKDLTSRVQAGKIIAPIAQKVGGSGGGRPDMAEAGGKDAAQLDAALESVYGVVESLTK